MHYIDSLPVPGADGVLGLVPCPGRDDIWSRLLARHNAGTDAELARLREWGASALLTLVEHSELVAMGIPDLGERARAAGLDWYHMPIADFCPPGREFEQCWQEHGREVRQRLRTGERVVVHCLAGLGRTGTVAARILVEFGTPPDQAVRLVRQARPGAIQSEGQMYYVMERRWKLEVD